MNATKYEEQGREVTLVVVGAFNPAIFQPFWFSSIDLLPVAESEAATIRLITTDICIFSTPRFSFRITHDRFVIKTADPADFMVVRDITVGVFQTLEHCPIRTFGLNAGGQFRFSEEQHWHQFEHHFAPKNSWNELLINPGLLSMEMQGTREGCEADRIGIKVSAAPGQSVAISLNEHYQAKPIPPSDDLEPEAFEAEEQRNAMLLRVLADNWQGFLSYSETVFEHLLEAPFKV